MIDTGAEVYPTSRPSGASELLSRVIAHEDACLHFSSGMILDIAAGFTIRATPQWLAQERMIEICLQGDVLLTMHLVCIYYDVVLESTYVRAAVQWELIHGGYRLIDYCAL